jgi:hypothetical protein
MPTKSRRRRTGRKRSFAAPRKPSGQIRYADTTLPPAEVIARRGIDRLTDQDAGDVFGIMQIRGMLPDMSAERVNGVPGPTPMELKVAGQSYGALVARYERTIGAPICAMPSGGGGRSLSADDVSRHARTQAQMGKALSVLRRFDHRCAIAMARAVAAVTVEQIDDALRWPDAIVQALLALHEASDDIRRAGRAAAERVEMEDAA